MKKASTQKNAKCLEKKKRIKKWSSKETGIDYKKRNDLRFSKEKWTHMHVRDFKEMQVLKRNRNPRAPKERKRNKIENPKEQVV